MSDTTLVNFYWTDSDGEVASFMLRWKNGTPLPRKGERVYLPDIEWVLEVELVGFNISPSRHSIDRLDSVLSIIDIGVRRIFRRPDEGKTMSEQERCMSCGSANVERQPYSYNPHEVHCLDCDDVNPPAAAGGGSE